MSVRFWCVNTGREATGTPNHLTGTPNHLGRLVCSACGEPVKPVITRQKTAA